MLRYLLLLTLLFFLISGVSAKTCGGDVPCGCGDVLKSSHNMTYDILNCSRGIHVSEGGIVLDCAGHKISGNGSMRGIYIASSGNTFKNCIISGFHTGILLWESSNNTITNNTVESNEYGISLEVLSKNNTIYGNTANKNSFCGIQLRQYSASNRVINNTANSNAMYGIYLQYYSDNSTVIGNTANSNSVHGIYMKYVLSNYIINNTLNSNAKSGLHLLGYSYNRIAGNKANSNSGSGIYMSSATHSSITGNSLNSNGEYGIYIGRDSYNNTLANNTAISNNKGEIYPCLYPFLPLFPYLFHLFQTSDIIFRVRNCPYKKDRSLIYVPS